MQGKDRGPRRTFRSPMARTAVTQTISVSDNESGCEVKTYVVILQELLRVVVAVDADLGNSIVHSGVLAASLNTGFKPWKDQLNPVALLYFVNQLVDGEVARHGGQQALDRCLIAVDI